MRRFAFVRPPVLLFLVLVLALLAGGVYFYLRLHAPTPSAEEALSASTTPAITFHDKYSKGTHTLTGFVPVVNVCVTIEAKAMAPTNDSIRVDIQTHPAEGICLELATSKPFSLEADADSDANVIFFVNGARATTTPS